MRRFVAPLALGLTLFSLTPLAVAQNNYPLTPDSERQAGVPQGRLEHFTFTSTKVYPGTTRDGWLYIPAQYNPAKPACVMVFQDGGGYQDNGGGYRIPIVFDNLIAKGEMPVTVGIFLNPGVIPPTQKGALPRYNRSLEYDSPTDLYVRFLLDEVLPDVSKKVNLSTNPNDRAIAGASSGGICAFTAAFLRPDAFRRVVSFVGSFTDLRGGHSYGPLIRKFEPKPIRVYMQDGANDQDIYSGSWPLGNQDVAAALRFARYDYQFVMGTGGHDGVQGRAVMPDALRFVWKGWPAPLEVPENTPQPIRNIVAKGSEWKAVEGLSGVSGVATSTDGTTYVGTDAGIVRVGSGPVTTIAKPGDIAGLAFGPDGQLWVASQGGRSVTSWDLATGKKTVRAKGFPARSVVVGSKGDAYATDLSEGGRIWLIPARGKARVVAQLPNPTGVMLVPDQTQLMVSSGSERYVQAYTLQADGSLSFPQPYHDIYTPHGAVQPSAFGMVTDTNGWLYLASPVGVQVLDQAGRVNGILVNPTATDASTQLAFSGKMLYCVAGGKLYRRELKATGVQPAAAPIQPPGPRL